MAKYEVLKTSVLGIGPWYVSPSGASDVLGMFRSKEHAELFVQAMTNRQAADSLNECYICGVKVGERHFLACTRGNGIFSR